MRLFTVKSSSVHQIAFDPSAQETEVYVSYRSNPDVTYAYGPWPTDQARRIVASGASVGQTLMQVRALYGDTCRRFSMDCDAASRASGPALDNRAATRIRDKAPLVF